MNREKAAGKRAAKVALAYVLTLFMILSVMPAPVVRASGAVVYLDGENGSDENSGADAEHAVASFYQAEGLLGGSGTIIVTGTLTVSGESDWYSESDVVLKASDDLDGPVIRIKEGGSLAIGGVTVSGGDVLIKNSGNLNLDGVVLRIWGEKVKAPEGIITTDTGVTMKYGEALEGGSESGDEWTEGSTESWTEPQEETGNGQDESWTEAPEETRNSQDESWTEAPEETGNSQDEGFTEEPEETGNSQDESFTEEPEESESSQDEGWSEAAEETGDGQSEDLTGTTEETGNGQSEDMTEAPQETGSTQSEGLTEAPEESGSSQEQDGTEAAEKPADDQSSSSEKATESQSESEQESEKATEGQNEGWTEVTEGSGEDQSEKETETQSESQAKDPVTAFMDSAYALQVSSRDDVMQVLEVSKMFDALTEEELSQVSQGAIEALWTAQSISSELNKTEAGVSVVGDFPWFVQFRVVLRDKSETASSEEGMDIIAPYELCLWNLYDDIPYYLPEGEQVTVMIPAPVGENAQEPVIFHYKADGSYEKIIPRQENGMLVFETSSFSPFSIAGSTVISGIGINGQTADSPGKGSKDETEKKDNTPGGSSTGGTSKPGNATPGGGSTGTGSTGGSSTGSGSTGGNSTGSTGTQTSSTTPQTSAPSGTGSSGQGQASSGSGYAQSSTSAPKTADETDIFLYVMLGAGALLLMAGALFAGRRRLEDL